MARKKQTPTQKLRSQLKRQIKIMERRGYDIPETIKQSIPTAKYQTLKSLQRDRYKKLYEKSSVTENDVEYSGTKYRQIERQRSAQKTSEKRRGVADFSYLAGTFDPETGEIYDFDPEKEFYDRTGYKQGGTLSADQATGVIIDNFVDDLISQLAQDVPDYYIDSRGKRRYLKPDIKDDIESARRGLLELIDQELSAGRGRELADRIQQNASEISDLIDTVFGYSAQMIAHATARLAQIITGNALSIGEMSKFDAYNSMINGYSEPE